MRATITSSTPITAVGVSAGLDLCAEGVPMVCLATAHPAKFADAVQQAIGIDPPRPESLRDIEQRPKRCVRIDADTHAIKEYVAEHALM